MNRDPRAWEILGRALRDSRTRQGISAEQLAERAKTPDSSVTSRTIYGFERAETVPTRKPHKLEQIAAALGWKPGAVDQILSGKDVTEVLGESESANTEPALLPARQVMLELLPEVYEFGRAAIAAGGDPDLRDQLETTARDLIASVPGRVAPDRSSYGLVAYRPHGAGEPIPEDDAERIQRALRRP